jgi:hypothetical protein
MDNILVLASAGALYAKIIVDMVRMAADLPRWGSPLLAVLTAIGAILLLAIAGSQAVTPALIAQAVLAGVFAGGSAVGVTELQKHATPSEAVRFLDSGTIGTARPDEKSE